MREMESRPEAKPVKLGNRKFDKDGDPIWAVPEWCANFPVMTPPSAEAIKAAEESYAPSGRKPISRSSSTGFASLHPWLLSYAPAERPLLSQGSTEE